jgi:uncharacterized protein YneF (UPF0154 family)
MPSPELMLLESAGGVFWATLIAFLVMVVAGAFIWMMKKVLDQNAAFNAQIIKKMEEIVAGMKEYKDATCDALEKHDTQAKVILETQQKTLTTLENRPCVARNATK